MELRDQTGVVLSGDSLVWNPIDGFKLHMLKDADEMAYYGNYTCNMMVSGNLVDSLVLEFKLGWNLTRTYAFIKNSHIKKEIKLCMMNRS